MRIGSTEAIEVEDLVFHCKRDWRSKRGHTQAIHAALKDAGISKRDEAVSGNVGDPMAADAALSALQETFIVEMVVSVEGLEDAEGEPLEWEDGAHIGDLPQDVFDELYSQLTGKSVEAGNAKSASETQPSPTSEVEA